MEFYIWRVYKMYTALQMLYTERIRREHNLFKLLFASGLLVTKSAIIIQLALC